MSDIEVLWLDDDISTSGDEILKNLKKPINGIRLITATSCEQSEQLLNTTGKSPQWAIVDLVVPQGSWGNEYYRIPGIEYISHLKNKFGDKINIVAFSIFINNKIASKVKDAGAMEAFVKSNISFANVLGKIQDYSNESLDNQK